MERTAVLCGSLKGLLAEFLLVISFSCLFFFPRMFSEPLVHSKFGFCDLDVTILWHEKEPSEIADLFSIFTLSFDVER